MQPSTAAISLALRAILGTHLEYFSNTKEHYKQNPFSKILLPPRPLNFRLKHPNLSSPTTEQSGIHSYSKDPWNLKSEGLLAY